ncbi:MAG: formylmethanofuran dehydrogenase subunit E family protein [Bryobacterales bacterium]|nr:formylmethanofuran dehydrogenase subunit E family protein [Bryobacterales bacterium]
MNPTRRAVLIAATTLPLRAHDDENPPPIARTTLIHGTASPYAVAGYQMGDYALQKLALERGSPDLEVTHHCPAADPLASSIIDGLQAATGASLGKRNLHCQDDSKTYSTIRNRKSGQSLRFELLPAFTRRYTAVSADKLYDAGAEVADLKPHQIFGLR